MVVVVAVARRFWEASWAEDVDLTLALALTPRGDGGAACFRPCA